MKPLFLLLSLGLGLTITLESQNTVLWKITKEDNKHTSYLMGTHHQTGGHFVDSLYPLIKEKLLQSEVAIFETVGENKTKEKIRQRKDDEQYKKVLRKKYIQRLEKIMARKKYPLAKFSPVEVYWLLGKLMVTERCDNYLPTDSLIQLDSYLKLLATQKSIKMIGLETPEAQLTFINKDKNNLDWLAVKKDKPFLKELRYFIDINSGVENAQNICAFSKKYKTLDLNYSFQKNCPDDVIIKERNKNWMKQLLSQMKQRNCFIAVGLAHLYYADCGIIAQLKANGFSVVPVSLK